MSTTQNNQWAWLIPIGIIGAVALYLTRDTDDSSVGGKAKGKEPYFLRYNKDSIMKSLIDTEEHFRNVKDKTLSSEGGMNCCVKHLLSAESHSEEATSHAAVVEGAKKSDRFSKLAENIRDFRYDVQKGITPTEGINRVRELRHDFENFNPEFDISKCEACSVK